MQLFNGNITELCDKIGSLSTNQRLVEFAGGNSINELLTKMQNGCKELTTKYNALPCEPIKVNAPSYNLANEGLFIDVATFLNSEPECWINESYTDSQKPAKEFYINSTFSSKTKEKLVFEKLIRIVQIIDSLEGNGQRLNVYVCCHTLDGDKIKENTTLICKVKDCSEPVNIHQLIYLCASTVILRYCMHRLQEEIFGVHYCSCVDIKEDEIQAQNSEIIYIPSFLTDKRNGITDYTKTDLKTAYKII